MTWYPAMAGARRRRGPVVLAVAVLVLVAVVLTWRLADRPPSPARSDTAGEPAGSLADERSTGLADPTEEIARIAGQVADVRGLALRSPVDARLVEQAELQRVIAREVGQDGGATGDGASRARLLAALRMLPRDHDLAGDLRELQDEQAVGLYVPGERRLYVHTEGRTTPQLRWASAHELVHALQHQHVDLEAMLRHPQGVLDAELAALALLEGDAVVTQEAWSRRFQTDDERRGLSERAAIPLLPLAGQQSPYLSERFAFPYDAGARFVVALIEEGGFAAVDAALADPPRSTADILDPQRYLAGTPVVTPELDEDPGPSWAAARNDELGAFDLREMLRPLGEARAAELVGGWAGGRVRSWEANGEVVVGGVVAYTAEEGAAALCAALPGWWRVAARAEEAGPRLLSSPDGAMAYRCDGSTVRFAVGPDERSVRALTGS